MPFSYSSEFREMVLDQIRAGRPVAELARDLEMHQSTLHRWKRQDRIDRGLVSGVSTAESAELVAARRRIRELEAELAAVKRASELFDEKRVICPKDLYPIVEALGVGAHNSVVGADQGFRAPSGDQESVRDSVHVDSASALWVPIIRSWALTRGFALHPGTRNRYEIRYTRTQHRPPSRQANDHGRVSGTHRAACSACSLRAASTSLAWSPRSLSPLAMTSQS